MNNSGKNKYFILMIVILIAATAVVVSIGYLKNYQIKQPQGVYMEQAQAIHLMEVMLDKAGYESRSSSQQTNINEMAEGEKNVYVTYAGVLSYVNQLEEAGMIDVNTAETYRQQYQNKYKAEHFFLEADFIELYVALAEQIIPEDAIHTETLTILAGGKYVTMLADGSTLNDDEVLTSEQQIFKIQLWSEKDGQMITDSCFQKISCLADTDEIFYVQLITPADLTLTRCFIAENSDVLKCCWEEYCLALSNTTDYNRMEDVTDLVIQDGKICEVVIYQNKIHGKILSLFEDGVELSMEDGNDVKYNFSEDVKVYKLYGSQEEQVDNTNDSAQIGSTLAQVENYTLSDLKVGYDFTDFVLDEQNEVVAALATREASMDDIRVLIKNNDFESIYHDKISIQCDTDFTLKSGNVSKTYESNDTVEITKDSPLFENDRIFIHPAALTSRIRITSLMRSQGTPAYRGTLEIVRTEEGLLCINEVLLEEYLYSVVPSEMPSSYPIEAQKAQAISARTYAYQHMVKSSLQKYGAHVDDSTSYQVYNNIMEAQTAIQAVRETSGEVALIDGEVAGTYFYSTSCGFGTDISVWHSDSKENTSHLKAKAISDKQSLTPQDMTDEETFRQYITEKNHDDFESEESWYRWQYTTTVDMDRLLSNLQSRQAAYPQQILTKQSDGSFTSETIDEIGDITDIVVNKRLLGGVIDELDMIGTKRTVRVISERNVRFVLANEADNVTLQNDVQSKVTSMLPSAFAVINTQKDDNGVVTSYEVIGGGYGHGIGLSQNGAKNMAEAGYDCEEIMQFFYEGIELIKIGREG